IILFSIVMVDPHIYLWLHPGNDAQILGKVGFLNTGFYFIWTILTVGLWIVLGWKMRQLSRELDNNPLPNVEAARKYIFKNTVWASLFIVWFALTVMSTS